MKALPQTRNLFAQRKVNEIIDVQPRVHRIKTSDYLEHGLVPVIDQGLQRIAGYIDDVERAYDGPLPVVIFGDHTCSFKFANHRFAVGADGTQLITGKPGVDTRYLYYALQTAPIQQFGYQRHFRLLKETSIPVPPVPMQHRIATILGAYDDLIEINYRRIAVVEEMVRGLFDEWFVNFHFPGHEHCKWVESPRGKIPLGWYIVKVRQLVDRQQNGQVYREADCEKSGQIIVIDQSSSEILGYHSNEPDHKATPADPITIFGDHTCKMQLMLSPFSLGPNTVALKAKEAVSIYYLFSLVRGLTRTKEYKRHWNDLLNNEVFVAPTELTRSYASLVRPLFQFQELLQRQNRVLRAQLDLSRPLLTSGAVKASVDARQLEAVA